MPHPNPDELFDVVDETDRVVGRATRTVVHRDGLRHRASHVFVVNGRGELYLQRRALTKDESPGRWDSSAAGHVDAGETYESAARRELCEELGIAVSAPLLEIACLPADRATGNEFRRLFVVRTDDLPVPDPVEVLEGRFFPLDELDRRLGDPTFPVTGAFLDFYPRYRAWVASSPAWPASGASPSRSPAGPASRT